MVGPKHPENIALFLASRQKRLIYWRDTFRSNTLPSKEGHELGAQLNTYALLLSKLTKQTSPAEREETLDKLLSLETKLTSAFELRRLYTGNLRPTSAASTIVMKPRESNGVKDTH